MDDLDAAYRTKDRWAAPRELRVAGGVDEDLWEAVGARLRASQSPVIITSAGADHPQTWEAMVAIAQALDCVVWQEPFGARAGHPEDSPRVTGHLPSARTGVRTILDGHDLILVVGTAALRQYAYEEGPLSSDGTDVMVLTGDRTEATRAVGRFILGWASPTR